MKIKKKCIGCNHLRIKAKKKLPPPLGTMGKLMKEFYDERLDEILSQKASSLIEEELLPAESCV